MTPPKYLFSEGERILCFHGPLIYEAKCLKCRVSTKDEGNEYWVHYAGWNKNWDEWVPEDRILKYNEGNVSKQKDLHKTHKSVSKKTKGATPKAVKPTSKDAKSGDAKSEGSVHDSDSRSSTPILDIKTRQKKGKEEGKKDSLKRDSPTPSQENSDPKKKKPKLDTTVEPETVFMQKVEIKVKMPEDLKHWIVDDWDLITRQKKLVNLPAELTVDSLLEDYIKFKTLCKTNTPNRESACREVVRGLKEYFNTMLGSQLLFKFERPQYSDMLASYPDKTMTQIYGVHHLLRLFVKIGVVLVYTAMNERSTSLLLATLQDVLKYVGNNSATLLSVQNYGIAPPEYHRKTI